MISTDSIDEFLNLTGLNLIIPSIGSPSSSSPSSQQKRDNDYKTIIADVLLAKGLLLNSNKFRGKEERPYKCALVSELKNEVSYFLIFVPSSTSQSIDINDHIVIPMNSKMSINPSFLSQRKLDENNFSDYSNNRIELTNGDGKSIIFKFEYDDDGGGNENTTLQGKWHKALKEVIMELVFKDAFVYGQDNKISIKQLEEVIQRAKKLVHTKNCHLTRARFVRDNKIKVQTILIKLLDDQNGTMLVSKEEVDELITSCCVDHFLSNDTDVKTLKLAAPYLLTSQQIKEMTGDETNGNGLDLVNENHEEIHHRAITLALSPSPSKDIMKSSSKNQQSPLPSYYSPSSKTNIILSSSKSQRSPSVASDNSNFSQASSHIYYPFSPEKVFDFSLSIESWIDKRKSELSTIDFDSNNINNASDSIYNTSSTIESESIIHNNLESNDNHAEISDQHKPISPIAETKDKGRRGLSTLMINQSTLSPTSKPMLKPPLQVFHTKSEDFTETSFNIGSKSDVDIVGKKSPYSFKKAHILVIIAICILGTLYLLLKVPIITFIHMDQDTIVIRIDRKRSSLQKPIPLSLQYTPTEKVDEISDSNQIDTSSELMALSSSSSTSSHSVKVISQMKTRLKEFFKPFVNVANFFGGLIFGKKK